MDTRENEAYILTMNANDTDREPVKGGMASALEEARRKGAAAGWYCKRCLRAMRRSRWGNWFDHVSDVACECQHAEWLDAE